MAQMRNSVKDQVVIPPVDFMFEIKETLQDDSVYCCVVDSPGTWREA